MVNEKLVEEFWPQLQSIADAYGYRRVTRIALKIGVSHGLTHDTLSQRFLQIFIGSIFTGTVIEIDIVEPGQTFIPPNSDTFSEATGWELLIMKMEGEE